MKRTISSVFFFWVITSFFFVEAQHARIGVISDLHYTHPALIVEKGKALEDYLRRDRKLLLESDALLRKSVENLLCEDVNVVLIPGDLTKDGQMVCVLHGTVESPEDRPGYQAEASQVTNESIFFDPQTNQYVSSVEIVNASDELTPWTTRVWNNYLADIVSLAINVPLFLLGLAFTAWVIYIIVMIPIRIFNTVIAFFFPGDQS